MKQIFFSKNNQAIKCSFGAGFTLIEIAVATAIVGVITFLIGGFAINILNTKNLLSPSFTEQQEMQLTISEIVPAIQTMSPSNIGSYPIAQAATSTLKFYSDIDGDGLFEQVRYFLDGKILKRGVLKPTGVPLSYNPANEKVGEVVHSVVFLKPTSTIFAYYDQTYIGSSTPMSQPVDISKIRVIGIEISTKQSGQTATSTTILKITPRKLRTNI